MITSALIAACRREYRDVPRLTQSSRLGNGVVNQFNTGKFPIVESSYVVYISGVAKTEVTDYTIDLDSGDIATIATPGNNIEVKATLKYANWRDKNWVDAINSGIEELNARGFFRQTVRESMVLSANVRVYPMASAVVDVYEVLQSPISGTYTPLYTNWSYQQDANRVILGDLPRSTMNGVRSYLRKMVPYTATSATLDVKDSYIELVKRYAGYKYFRSMASKIAQQGHATVEDGHFSFSNMRAQGQDLFTEFDIAAKRAKPTRPAKDLQFIIDGSGPAA